MYGKVRKSGGGERIKETEEKAKDGSSGGRLGKGLGLLRNEWGNDRTRAVALHEVITN